MPSSDPDTSCAAVGALDLDATTRLRFLAARYAVSAGRRRRPADELPPLAMSARPERPGRWKRAA